MGHRALHRRVEFASRLRVVGSSLARDGGTAFGRSSNADAGERPALRGEGGPHHHRRRSVGALSLQAPDPPPPVGGVDREGGELRRRERRRGASARRRHHSCRRRAFGRRSRGDAARSFGGLHQRRRHLVASSARPILPYRLRFRRHPRRRPDDPRFHSQGAVGGRDRGGKAPLLPGGGLSCVGGGAGRPLPRRDGPQPIRSLIGGRRRRLVPHRLSSSLATGGRDRPDRRFRSPGRNRRSGPSARGGGPDRRGKRRGRHAPRDPFRLRRGGGGGRAKLDHRQRRRHPYGRDHHLPRLAGGGVRSSSCFSRSS